MLTNSNPIAKKGCLMIVIRRTRVLKEDILIHHTMWSRWWLWHIGVVAACSRCWYVMVMLALICCYDCFLVCGSPLNMLTHIAPLVGALIVAPIGKNKQFRKIRLVA